MSTLSVKQDVLLKLWDSLGPEAEDADLRGEGTAKEAAEGAAAKEGQGEWLSGSAGP